MIWDILWRLCAVGIPWRYSRRLPTPIHGYRPPQERPECGRSRRVAVQRTAPQHGRRARDSPRAVPSDHHAHRLDLGIHVDGHPAVLAPDAGLLEAAERHVGI